MGPKLTTAKRRQCGRALNQGASLESCALRAPLIVPGHMARYFQGVSAPARRVTAGWVRPGIAFACLAVVALTLQGRARPAALVQKKVGPDDEDWERRPTSASPFPEVRALSNEQRDAV